MDSRVFDVWLLFGFGVLGFFMNKHRFPAAPMIMAIVLGPMMENAMRQSLMMSQGSPLVFVNRPLSAFILVIALMFVTIPLLLSRLERTSG